MSTPEFVRTLNPEGCRLFGLFAAAAKLDPLIEPPYSLLYDNLYSSPLAVEIPVVRQHFANRYEFGRYLDRILAPLNARLISRDQGLWNWLSLYHFAQLWTPKKDGRRTLGEPARYVLPERYNYNKYYRHLVREPWNFIRMHGEVARVALNSPLYIRGDIAENLGSRQWAAGNTAIFEAAGQLYVGNQGETKRGVGDKHRPGTVRRLGAVMQQLDRTYDLSVCDAGKVLVLLPEEFDNWKDKETARSVAGKAAQARALERA